MTPPETVDGRSAHDLFWAAIEDPPRPVEVLAPCEVYAAFDVAAGQ